MLRAHASALCREFDNCRTLVIRFEVVVGGGIAPVTQEIPEGCDSASLRRAGTKSLDMATPTLSGCAFEGVKFATWHKNRDWQFRSTRACDPMGCPRKSPIALAWSATTCARPAIEFTNNDQ